MRFPKVLSLSHYLKKRKLRGPTLQERFQSFQALLRANNDALEIMGDMEEKYSGDYPVDRRYIRASYNNIRENVSQMITALNQMVPNRYNLLYKVFESIDQEIQKKVFGKKEIPISPLIIPLAEITQEMMEKVGGKNSNLGEMRNRAGVPIPEGFAITSYAYKILVEDQVLEKETKKQLANLDINDLENLSSLSRKIQQSILSAPIPPALEEAIFHAYDQLTAKVGRETPLSVRSSAVKEDSDSSFAGQFTTVLNVRRGNLLQSYKEVLASKFTPQAISYWKNKGFSEEDIPMAVGCLTMIPAKISGVMYTQDPNHPERKAVIISAAWGLGEIAVGGLVSPSVYVVSRANGQVLDRTIQGQEVMSVCHEDSGITEVSVPEALKEKPCLDEGAIQKLYQYALKLERHYKTPQDIEWAIDPNGKIYILQTRLLKISSSKEKEEKTPPEVFPNRVLINWGVVAAPGVGAGPVYLVKKDQDLAQFPPGGILVAKHTSPKYITVMNQASAIITDIGNVTGHMAALAREFQVPTIVDTKEGTKMLRTGQVVTVDALRNIIYEGVVEKLIPEGKGDEIRKQTPLLRKLEEILSSVVPLRLVDPKAESFQPDHCQTFHDLTRYMHEVSIQEMFKFNEMEKSSSNEEARKLISDIPINLYIINLGDGLVPQQKEKNEIRPEDIASRPMKAFWCGLTHPAVRWTGVVEVDLKGFASVMLNTLSDSARYGATMGEKSYALISREYMNFSSRLAYHISTIDAYCSEIKNNNYITFHFMGGGSSSERRVRRVRFIRGVLKKLDFDVEVKGDWLLAKLMKYECQDIATKLDYLGRLICCARQLDMVMYSDGVVNWYVRAFMEGNYSFKKSPFLKEEGSNALRPS